MSGFCPTSGFSESLMAVGFIMNVCLHFSMRYVKQFYSKMAILDKCSELALTEWYANAGE